MALAVFAWWAADEGGAAPGSWYPGALLLLVALVAVVRPGNLSRLPAPARWALPLFAAFTAWSFVSIAWADDRGDGWDSANRTLLYLTVFALFAALRWTRAQAATFLAGFALVTAAAGAWEVIRAIAGNDAGAFVGGRLAGPIGYENASAALFLAAFWPTLLLSAHRSTPRPARGILLAAAGVLLELCVLAQSRGSLIAGTFALVLAVVVARERARLLVALTAVAITTLASLPVLLAVFDSPPALGRDALDRAGIAMALSVVVLLVGGIASPRRLPPLWVAATAAGTLAMGAIAVAVAGSGVVPGGGDAAAGSRFTAGAESGRYDLWRVAARQLARHPLQGAGAGDFAHDYARERHRVEEEPLYPHSIVLGTFGQTGIVGGLLLIGFLAAALLGVRPEPIAGAAVVCAAAWVAHASIDWLWELPALTAPAMACLGLTVSLSATGHIHTEPVPRPGRLGRIVAIAAAVGAAVSYALPALAAREIERAVRHWDRDPAGALRGLDRARRLNPLSDRADVIAGALALEHGDRRQARRSFRRAAGRDGQNWYPEAQLGVLDLGEGHREDALVRLSHAHRMNPLEPAIARAFIAARRGAPLPPDIQQRLSQLAVPGPLGRRPVTCRPVLGLAAVCVRGVGA